jgi:hypothetical protein
MLAPRTTHGMSKHTPEYAAWNNMRSRCWNPKNKMYSYYGGRGIVVDDSFKTFEGFFKEVGHRPPGTSLDRIDNNLGYAPGNVRWVTKAKQMLNRSDNRYLTLGEKTQTLREWSDETGISVGAIWARIEKYGWSVERALTEPVWDRSKSGKLGADARWRG